VIENDVVPQHAQESVVEIKRFNIENDVVPQHAQESVVEIKRFNI
jgi:hypothetical protein